MFKFALKNLWTRKSKSILTVISIIIATTIGLLAFNISSQVEDGIINTVSYYDTLVGPSGSDNQLALNTLFFTGTPVGTIDYHYYEMLKNDKKVNDAIPFAMGDSYKSAKIVGTEARYLENHKLKDGKLFSDKFEAVFGYNVAKESGLKVGDTFLTSHGISESGNTGHEHNEPYTVSGILAKTNTAYDNVVFISIEDVWAVHGTGEHAHEEAEPTDHEHEENEHETGKSVTAVLVKSKGINFQLKLSEEINKIAGLQAINPTSVVREVMDNIDLSKQIVFILCFVIGVMAFVIVYIVALLNMYDAKKDIKLMRLLGISKGKINGILVIQNLFMVLIAMILSVVLCRALLIAVNSFTSGMGIVINYLKFYIEELYIIGGIIIVSLIPSWVVNLRAFKKDAVNS